MYRNQAFTLAELAVIVIVVCVALVITVAISTGGTRCRGGHQLQNRTQTRGIQQGMATFASGNGGHYPGFDASGNLKSAITVSAKEYGAFLAEPRHTLALFERQAAQRDARASVSSLWARLASLEDRIRRLQESVLPALADNQQLSIKSQQAGQIGLLELIVVSRQSLDARRDLIDALADYQSTRIALELAAGWPQEGTQP